MRSFTVIHVGDFKEEYFACAEAEYIRRIKPFADYKTVCVREESTFDGSEKNIARALEREAAEIRRHIPRRAMTVALCIEGTPITSPGLAEMLSDESRPVCFIIGSSHGLDPALKNECGQRISMSRMTFPHMLARVMLAEQVYRAITIITGKKYHK